MKFPIPLFNTDNEPHWRKQLALQDNLKIYSDKHTFAVLLH